jgi:hypothetical protein
VSESPWDNLRVVHLDVPGSDRRHPEDRPEPTGLAPWRIWLCRHYMPCTSGEAFVREVNEAPGAVIALVHRHDLEAAAFDIGAWLAVSVREAPQRPCRLLILYDGNWNTWGECSLDHVLPALGGRLPAELWDKAWRAMPWWHLVDAARPLAWVGRRIDPLSLPTVAQRFPKWHLDACECLCSGLDPGKSKAANLTLLRGVIRHSLLVEWLDLEGNRTDRASAERRRNLLKWGDNCWLLEGIAESIGWPTCKQMACSIRGILEDFLGRCCSRARLEPCDRPSWQPTVDAIQELLNR